MSGLDAGLVKAGADPNAVNPEKQGEEGGTVTVEDVKREIRGLKGLLLSRYVELRVLPFGSLD